jgi:predicted nucleotidyltransferase
MYKKRSKVKVVIKQYIRELSKLGIHVQKVILYGSYAKGDFRKDSDIDLVIVSEDFKKRDLRERLEILGIAAVRIMKPIEAYGVTSDEIRSPRQTAFLKEAISSGIGIKS